MGLKYLEDQLKSMADGTLLQLDPDFQRAHVWTEAQQSAYVEYLLQGGPSARIIYWACEGWQSTTTVGPMVLVDGKQRLEAVRRFLRNEIKIFGQYLEEFPDTVRVLHLNGLKFFVADLGRKETLRWYIALNAGGTPHTSDEIKTVQALLAAEEQK